MTLKMKKKDRQLAKLSLIKKKQKAKIGSPKTPEAVKEKLSAPIYRNIIEDLVAFTGFPEEEVCFRISKKTKSGFGARGWFNEEFDFFNPQSPIDYDWYYRCSQTYVFTNARRSWWGHIDLFGKEDQPILDYGAGIGQNPLEFYYRGMIDSWYFELGTLQTEFFKFRCKRHGFTPKVIEPYWEGKFDPFGCLNRLSKRPDFNLIILQDVLEHVHDYPRVLRAVVGALRPLGRIIEHSPFAPKQDKTGRYPHMHLADETGLKKVMGDLGMQLQQSIAPGKTSDTKFTVHVWIKK